MQDTRNVSLTQLVLECTDEILSEPDYSKQLDIVERLQGSKSRAKEVVEALGARLEKMKKSENAVYLSLHLADFVLKNVPEVAAVMAHDSFQKVIVKLGKGKTLKGKALVLLVCKVQEWSYLFQNCRGFQDTYIALQKAGVEFPPPTRELMEEQSRRNERRINIEVERKRLADPLRKLKDSVVLLQQNVRLVIEMIAAVDPAVEDVRSSELIPPLLESIAKQRPRITELISTTQDEELMGMLLVVNDDINNTFEWYQLLLSGVRPQIPTSQRGGKPSTPLQESSPPPVARAHQDEVALSPPPLRGAAPSQHQQQQQQEDPFAALARQRKARTSGAQPSGAQSPPNAPTVSSSADLLFFGSPSPQQSSVPVMAPVVTPVSALQYNNNNNSSMTTHVPPSTNISVYPNYMGAVPPAQPTSAPAGTPFDVFLLASSNNPYTSSNSNNNNNNMGGIGYSQPQPTMNNANVFGGASGASSSGGTNPNATGGVGYNQSPWM